MTEHKQLHEAQKPTAEQAAAFVTLQEWWQNGGKNIIVSGSPGTGKTWLVKHIVNQLKGAVPLYTAPTNEAVRQLQLSIGRDACTKTTYSAFGLKMNMYSERPYIDQGRIPEDLDNFNLLIVDETSMVGKKLDAKEWDRLADYVLAHNFRTIWLGDDAQLPPIESTDGSSPIFKMDWPRIHLTQVVRHEGPILAFANALREQVFSIHIRNLPQIPEGIHQISSGAFAKALGSDSEIYQAHVNGQARTIAWTNKQVDFYNNIVREHRFGPDVAKKYLLCPGDSILFVKPLMWCSRMESLQPDLRSLEDLELRHSINTKAEVIRVEEAKLFEVECYRVRLEVEGGIDSVAYIPTPAGEKQYKNLIKQLTEDAKNAIKNKGAAWALRHTVDSCFADTKHSYAMTGHRSQGSTIPQVFVDVGNLLKNPDRVVAFKNLYVACTRARDNLTLIRG